MKLTNCKDEVAAEKMYNLIKSTSEMGDSIGSSVEVSIEGLPMGVGEPWFDGLEPALARALMAIPAARAIEFGEGVYGISLSECRDVVVKGKIIREIQNRDTGSFRTLMYHKGYIYSLFL